MSVVHLRDTSAVASFNPFPHLAALAGGLPDWMATAPAPDRVIAAAELSELIDLTRKTLTAMDPIGVLMALQKALPAWFETAPLADLERFADLGEAFSYSVAALCAARAQRLRADFLAGTHDEQGRPI